ncbi:MAG: flavodoxin family protein [Reyranellaceae bacterium]
MTSPRKGQAPDMLDRAEFGRRFRQLFFDPRFEVESEAIARLEGIAWSNFQDNRKAPRTVKAGAGFADPGYDLSRDWLDARNRLVAAQKRHGDGKTRTRILVICGSPRNDGTCPGEMSKTWRLAQTVCEQLAADGAVADLLDLSLAVSEYGRTIHPCKGCVSTAMPLCHWPCSCYPNHALHQIHDWMNDIYEKWVEAHGVIILTPVHWYQSPSALKLMIDRLVCADGGNPDPTATHGKDAEKAKALEADWDYPKHLAGRAYGLFVHGDVVGAEHVRRSLSEWLDWMGLRRAGPQSQLDRYIGYFKPYATSHDSLDADQPIFGEVRNIARAVLNAATRIRQGGLTPPDEELEPVRMK